MDKFFTNFPTTVYNGVTCVDITRRVRLDDEQRKNIDVFYPLEINETLRADHISDAYYQDPEMDWVIYLANDIVDPYYQWYLSGVDFDAYMIDKYGSLEYAQKKIKVYINNWATDDKEITESFYENSLAYDQKQYYTPNYGANLRIINYRRKRENWFRSTNKILQYTFTVSSGNGFSNGELLDIKYSGETVGTGEVVVANSTVLFLQHVAGNTIANTTWSKTLQGETTNTVATTTAMVVTQENISNAEAIFWDPITYYDWELAQNEQYKILSIIDADYALDIVNNIRDKLSE